MSLIHTLTHVLISSLWLQDLCAANAEWVETHPEEARAAHSKGGKTAAANKEQLVDAELAVQLLFCDVADFLRPTLRRYALALVHSVGDTKTDSWEEKAAKAVAKAVDKVLEWQDLAEQGLVPYPGKMLWEYDTTSQKYDCFLWTPAAAAAVVIGELCWLLTCCY